MMPQQYCLRWKYHHSNVQSMFAQLLDQERFCDVTLYCSPSFATQVPNKDTVEPKNIRGVSLRAHRVVLAACSELLGALLGAHDAQGEPVIVIDGAEPKHLKALLDYMYTGEMNVHHSQLASLLKTAEELRIKGLTDIRWNNKDEPPDCASGAIAATAVKPIDVPDKPKLTPVPAKPVKDPPKVKVKSPERVTKTPPPEVKKETEDIVEKSVNGGPPPLIKLPVRDKSITPKREHSDTESPSPKRQRLVSATEITDDESNMKIEKENDWHHGNMDISASRVCWAADGAASPGSSRSSGDEWADAPADIGSFLHTRLRVDGDNSADEESSSGGSSRPGSAPEPRAEPKSDPALLPCLNKLSTAKPGSTDPRFSDVIKLNDYLQHGRRPQFWEETYVKRVMEAVRLKELEMKQAAEILGVSYGTLYGRYRDVYGCINRPYRAVRDFWQVKGPSEVLERLQRGEIALDAAASALGVSVANLAAHVADFGTNNQPVAAGEFEPIPIELDPSLRARTYSGGASTKFLLKAKQVHDKPKKAVLTSSVTDEESLPVSIISTADTKTTATAASGNTWPSIRVASIDSLRDAATPSQLMKTRPDLTIVAAKRDAKPDDES